jgi:uncharacterized membrane protein YgdD (TMEM256/DUF423 family)
MTPAARLLRWSAVLNGAAVLVGAFGAHALKTALSQAPDSSARLATFETGNKYHFIHALALGLIALAAEHMQPRWARAAALLFALGMVLFSGSLYLLAVSGARWLGAVTPLGGLAFIAGWGCFALSLKKS